MNRRSASDGTSAPREDGLQREDFSKAAYAAPFGRYEVAAPSKAPANEVLVGRERERARVIDWLLTLARSGALLVTGHRGVGKTQFVDFCLHEFEQDVYKRYLRSPIGRVWFWDLGTAAILIMFILFVPVLLSSTLEILCEAPTLRRAPAALWGLLTAGPIAVILAHPMLYAWRMLHAASEVLTSENNHGGWFFRRIAQRRKQLILAMCITAGVGLWIFGPFADASVGVACLICLIAWLHCVAHAVSIRCAAWPMGEDTAFVDRSDQPWWLRASMPVLFVLGAVALTWPGLQHGRTPQQLREGYLGAFLIVAFAGYAARTFDAWRMLTFLKDRYKAENLRIERARSDLNRSVSVASVFLLCAMLGLVQSILPAQIIAGVLVLVCFVAAIRVRCFLCSRAPAGCAFRFSPRGRYVLGAKACICFIFSLQLLTPLLVWTATHMERVLDPRVSAALAKLPDLGLFKRHLAPLVPNLALSHAPLTVWTSVETELWWLILAGFLAGQIICFEYSWIVRPHEPDRMDSAYSPAAPKRGQTHQFARLLNARELAQSTIFWLLFETWLPVLNVRINLGFDAPSHARVVEAMLVGLRESYHRTFISWRSRVGMGLHLIQLLAAFMLAMVVGSRLLEPVLHHFPDWARLDIPILTVPDQRPNAVGRALWQILPYTEVQGSPTSHKIQVRGYHVLLFIAIYVLTRRVLGIAGFYHTIDRRLRELSERLSSTVKISLPARAPVQIGGVQVVAQGEAREISSEPQDPRAIEYAFRQILNSIVQPFVRLPVQGSVLSLPAPEVVFIFDELDKIGTRSPGVGETALEGTRIQQLHALFADMKNLLSVAPARFIFVGGRNLHDEWLADQTQFRPLLSSIFDIEVYLPTLLSDPLTIGVNDADPTRGTRAFINAQFKRVNHLRQAWERDKRIYNRLRAPPVREPCFVQAPLLLEPGPVTPGRDDLAAMTLWRSKPSPAIPAWAPDFKTRWLNYMAFRSRGVPRALHELLESFVHPTGRVVTCEHTRFEHFDCQHVVFFNDIDRYRVQFVASLFRSLCGTPQEHPLSRSNGADQLVHRQDDTLQLAFYLADVLLKFHGRAFSWSNLERVDELANVHAPAGLRDLLQHVVHALSATHITTPHNGIYSFRFRSVIDAEIRYISRHSPKEMAALNFTLNESQALRQHFLQRLAATEPGSRARYELEAAVGELYDFDERYDHARAHYDGAIRALDARFGSTSYAAQDKGILVHALDGSRGGDGNNPARRHIYWGVARIRLMLQIGMTFERTRSYEQALAAYRETRTLSRTLWFAMLDARGRGDHDQGSEIDRHRLHTLKHLPLLYQALFATAWLAEKSANAYGTSTVLLEQALWDLRGRLPSVRGGDDKLSQRTHDWHPEFYLLMAEVHQATAQLYFFKGNECVDGEPKRDGHLRRAEYHYLVSVHEVKRALAQHARGVHATAPQLEESAAANACWPESVVQRLTPTLFGLARTWIARAQLRNLSKSELGNSWEHPARAGHDAHWLPNFVAWMGGRRTLARSDDVYSWLGSWSGSAECVGTAPLQLLTGCPAHEALGPKLCDVVPAYLKLTTIAIELLARADHRAAAAQECLASAAALENLLSCVRALAWISDAPTSEFRSSAIWLAHAALNMLDRAGDLFLERTGQTPEFGAQDIDRVPPYTRTLAVALGLHATAVGDEALRHRAAAMVARWKAYPQQACARLESREDFRARLYDDLSWQVYPMLNRLMALRVLVIDAALASDPECSHAHMVELGQMHAAYAAPMIFTPFHYGSAAALWALRLEQLERPEAPQMAAHALRALRASVGAMSTGAQHYEHLADLYYLDGDFSDQSLQAVQAQQLAASELTLALIAKLERRDERDSAHEQAAQ